MNDPRVEIVATAEDHSEEERVRSGFASYHTITPGTLGKIAAALTMLAAAMVIGAFLFGKIILLSAAATFLWPVVFSADFTRWVFGADSVPFWKILLLFTFIGFAARWVRGWMRD